MPLLTVKNLHIAAGQKPLVQGVSFTLNKGETLAVVGESGSGKTLTALAVMGLLAEGLTPCADAMEFNKLDLLHMSPKARRSLRGKQMAMIFQEPATALNPVLTCGYQVEEAFIIHTSLSRKQRKAKVIELFEKVKLPEPERMYRSYPHQLSGGQRQRVMIAMALAHKPDILIADEPTTALDVTVQAEILKLVKDLQAEMGMAMLWITHDFGVVEKIADRVLVMQHGKLVEEGTLAHVLKKPKQRYTKQLLAATLTLSPIQRKHGGKKPQTVVQAQNLSLTYRESGFPFLKKPTELKALQNAAFTLAKGRTLGVVGESGSGKSTLARVLTRLAEPDANQQAAITLLGENFLVLKGEKLRTARKNLQMVFQDPAAALNPKMTIGNAVAEGIRAHNLMPEKQIAPYVKKLLESCGLPADAAGRYPHQFSGGQKQRICIARALALQPDVVICDEAVSALDVSVQAQILALLQSIQAQTGTSFIFISHDLRVVSHLADDVLVMHKGKIVESGPTAQVFTKPKHAYTKKLLSAVI